MKLVDQQVNLEDLESLSLRLLDSQEMDRSYLAQELHGNIGHKLTELKSILKLTAPQPLENVNDRVEAGRVLEELQDRVSQLSFDFRPAALDHLGLIPALVTFIERYTEQTGVTVDFKHSVLESGLHRLLRSTAYRIVQECLTNVSRHARIPQATLRLWTDSNQLHLKIEDRGIGFDVSLPKPTCRGLKGIQDRVLLLRGSVSVESGVHQGTNIMVTLPLLLRNEDCK
jgi:signal transduction histidine kinase